MSHTLAIANALQSQCRIDVVVDVIVLWRQRQQHHWLKPSARLSLDECRHCHL